MAREPTSFFAVRAPMPPPLNDQYIVSRSSKKPILSRAARQYKRDAAHVVRTQLRLTPYQDIGGYLRITMRQHYEDQQQFDASDWDGRVKLLQDVVCKVLGINDNRITLATIEKAGIGICDSYVDVEVMPR